MYRMRLIIAVLLLTIVAWPGAIAGEGTWESVYEFSGTATVNIQSDFHMPSGSGGSWNRHWQATIVYQITGTEGDGPQLRPSGSITGSISSEERKVSGKCETKTVCTGTIQERFGRSPKRAGPQIKINRKLGLYMLSFPSADPEGDCTATDSCLGKTFHKQGPLRKIVVYIPAPYCHNRQECKGASFDPESKKITGNYSTTIEDPNTPQRTQISAQWTFRLVKAEPPKIKVKAVYFNYGSNKADADKPLKETLTLLRHLDDKPIEAPEWKDDGTRKPAAFVLGYPFKVTVVFEAEEDVEKALIQAYETSNTEGFGGLEPTRKDEEGEPDYEVKFENNNPEVEYVINSPPHIVAIFDVKWLWKAKIKLRNRNEFEDEKHFDTTDHTVYVVAKSPIPTACTYEYAVRKSCEWADGCVDLDDVFRCIWDGFWDIPSPDDPGQLLQYLHDEEPKKGTGPLLRDGKGTCRAWADFFYDTVGSHGIQISHVTIKPNPPFNWLVAQKVAAQGNDKPARVFTDHAITAYKGRYYDPSYGIDTEQDCLTYENQAFAAYCQVETLNFLPPIFDNWITTCRPLYHQGKYNQFADCLATQEPPGCQVNKKEEPCEVTME